jgi:hypothetical protein
MWCHFGTRFRRDENRTCFQRILKKVSPPEIMIYSAHRQISGRRPSFSPMAMLRKGHRWWQRRGLKDDSLKNR